ncbi:sensor histidine kinase [Haliangium sp.]|uniref:sensor histidine kinase n=1 Tax=Haliangium sp. TaxID=2663208 RepID=UPI003D0BA2B5
MSRQSAIDAPVLLGDLLGRDDLDELAAQCRELFGVHVAVHAAGGSTVTTAVEGSAEARGLTAALAADAGAADPVRIEVAPGRAVTVLSCRLEGRPLAAVAVGPYPSAGDEAVAPERAAAMARHLAAVLDILVHHARARHMTSTLHAEAVEETFAELEGKNERLEQAVEHMQEVDRLKSSFLATISHELRTPLTSVIGYAEMLYEGLAGPVNDEQREFLQTILSKADQLLQLITSLLEAAILESGPVPMQREPLPVRETIERVVSGLGPHARSRQIALRRVEPDLPRVLGDERKVRQVLRNLIANAVKFTDEGDHIDIDVHLGPLARDGDDDEEIGVRVVVSDAGIGIAPEQQEHIFEPFFQVDSSSTRKYGGTGVGLTLAKSYIEANGGHIWVDSSPGQGSAFTFTLPIAAASGRAGGDGGGEDEDELPP